MKFPSHLNFDGKIVSEMGPYTTNAIPLLIPGDNGLYSTSRPDNAFAIFIGCLHLFHVL